ncbi:MAG TPA: cation:proton antiporter subunit C [Firmicutes bacterium]|jgi:multicomponent Na+:H+ antiporter subunit C|nr:cation:proton antiporter subunit C [Bacillota bacterium]
MGEFWSRILQNYPYVFALALFAIGIYTILTHSNLFKKVIGINIMEGSIYILFIAAGNVRGGVAPILDMTDTTLTYVHPLPQALMLTGIVVSVSVTALSLALIMKLYRFYGTVDAKEIMRIRTEVRANGARIS